MEENNYIFIIGESRSGSTWLQLMLASHPHIATTLELPFFRHYAYPLMRAWEAGVVRTRELKGHKSTGGVGDLPYVLDEERFTTWLRDFSLLAYGAVLESKPEATHAVTRDRFNSFVTKEIHTVLPEAKFIHVLRDGRDVACSLVAAYRDMGWRGTKDFLGAAVRWRECTRATLQASQFSGTYLLVRYEEMLQNPANTLKDVFAFCGIEVTPEQAKKIADKHTFEKLKQERSSQDSRIKRHEQFYRKGKVGSWREEMYTYQKILFAWAAGGLLSELGHEEGAQWYQKPYWKFMLNLPLAAVVWYLWHWYKKLFPDKVLDTTLYLTSTPRQP